MKTDSRYGVVVGIDGSTSSDLALDWAVEEARRRHLPLHLVHARGLTDWWVRAGAPVPPELIDEPDDLLQERVARVRQMDPSVTVTSGSSVGHAAESLIALSRDADVVALGARGRGPATQMLLGSVSAQVAAHAASPVVVVRRAPHTPPGQPRVIVGVDGSSASQGAVAYAFEQASARSLGLTVVHAWTEVVVGGLAVLAGATEQRDAMAQERQAMVSEALAGERGTYPEVDVDVQIVKEPPADALLERAGQAELLVVGSRGLGGFSGLLMGSVSRAVLARATCPVAVVRPDPDEE